MLKIHYIYIQWKQARGRLTCSEKLVARSSSTQKQPANVRSVTWSTKRLKWQLRRGETGSICASGASAAINENSAVWNITQKRPAKIAPENEGWSELKREISPEKSNEAQWHSGEIWSSKTSIARGHQASSIRKTSPLKITWREKGEKCHGGWERHFSVRRERALSHHMYISDIIIKEAGKQKKANSTISLSICRIVKSFSNISWPNVSSGNFINCRGWNENVEWKYSSYLKH